MGNNGMYPSHPHSHNNMIFNHPYHNHGIYSPRSHTPFYGYPINNGISYGRGSQQPYSSMMNHGPMRNAYQQNVFHSPIDGRGFYNSPYGTSGGLQSAPPSPRPNGHIDLHRPNEHRPHFDDQ